MWACFLSWSIIHGAFALGPARQTHSSASKPLCFFMLIHSKAADYHHDDEPARSREVTRASTVQSSIQLSLSGSSRDIVAQAEGEHGWRTEAVDGLAAKERRDQGR